MFTRPIGLLGPQNFATPVWIGTGSLTSGTSATVVTNAAVKAGDTICLYVPTIGANGIISVSDPSGNTYTHIYDTGVNGLGTNIWAAFATKGLPSGSTITVSFGASNSSIQVIAWVIKAVLPFSSLDQAPVANSSSAGTAVSPAITCTTASPREVAAAFVAVQGNVTISPNSGWTTIKSVSGSTISMLIAFQLLLNTASLSWAPTWSTSLNWTGGIITVRGYN